MWIVAIGHLKDGFRFVGPFSDFDDPRLDELVDEGGSVIELEEPEDA